MDASVEGAVCPPPTPHILLVHAIVFLGACGLCLWRPGWATALGILATVSFWGELRGSPRILRGVLMNQLSGNMIARLKSSRPRAVLVLVAHADVGSSALHFHPWVKHFTVRSVGAGRSIHPGVLVLLAGGAQIFAAIQQLTRGDLSQLGSGALLSATIIHLGLLALSIDWWRSPPVEGAIDNASGLAVVWAVARELTIRPLKHTELWVLATGDKEHECGGMRAFLHQSAYMFDPGNTFFVNIDEVGRGTLHYASSEGRWDRLSYRATLPALAERISQREMFAGVGETSLVGLSDAGLASQHGYRAITLSSLDEGERARELHTPEDRVEAIDPASLEQAFHFSLALAREIDSFVGGE